MSYAHAQSRYLEAEVLSRSPEWLVPFLYEQALLNLRRAVVQIEVRNFEGKADSLTRATDILLELAATLDQEAGGIFAQRMGALYGYFVQEIGAVGQSLDLARLHRVIAMLAELHEAWVQAAEQVAPRGRSAPAALQAAV